MTYKAERYSIGSAVWPGLSKLTEECGEVQQVIGKLMGTGGIEAHWDGTNLRERLTEEIGDLMAACVYVAERNGLDRGAIAGRIEQKRLLFDTWHDEQAGEAGESDYSVAGLLDGLREWAVRRIEAGLEVAWLNSDQRYCSARPCPSEYDGAWAIRDINSTWYRGEKWVREQIAQAVAIVGEP